MMNAKEIANAWKEIVRIYNETREIAPPEGTMCDISKQKKYLQQWQLLRNMTEESMEKIENT